MKKKNELYKSAQTCFAKKKNKTQHNLTQLCETLQDSTKLYIALQQIQNYTKTLTQLCIFTKFHKTCTKQLHTAIQNSSKLHNTSQYFYKKLYTTLHNFYTTLTQQLYRTLHNLTNFTKLYNYTHNKTIHSFTQIYNIVQNCKRLYTTLHNFTILLQDFLKHFTKLLHNFTQLEHIVQLYKILQTSIKLYNTFFHIQPIQTSPNIRKT